MSEATLETDAQEQKPRISVFNLPAGISRQDDLRELCKPFGTVVNVEFVPPRGQKPAFGFVTFKTHADAEFAIYRLNNSNLGNTKGPVRAGFPPERPKREQGSAGEPRQKRPKKPMTSLSLLTPKNLATSPPAQEVAPNVKKSWDLPRANQAAQQQTQTPPNKTRQGGYQKKGQNEQHNGKPDQSNHQNLQAAHEKPNEKPHNQPEKSHNQPQTHEKGQSQEKPHPQSAQAQGQPKGPKGQGKKPPTTQDKPHVPQNPHVQQSPPQTHEKTGQQGQPKGPKGKKPAPAYVCHVLQAQTNLVLHVLELNQAQYDQLISPLVQVPMNKQ